MKELFFIPLIMVLIAGLIFGGCAKPEPTTPTTTSPATTTPEPTDLTPKYGGVLKIIAASTGGSIGWPPDGLASGTCLENLLRGDNKGGVHPWLAESYKVADDLKSITLNLRREVKFHDGSDFNAEVAKWNLDNMLNARLYPTWASVDIVDDYTIRLNLSKWTNYALISLADDRLMPAWMVSKVAFDKNGIDWMRQNPVGTGPFKLESYSPFVSINVVRNTDYWVEGKPYLDGIESILVADLTTQKMLMLSGEGDMLGEIPIVKDAADLAAQGLTIKFGLDSNTYLVPDSTYADSPWVNQKVREAAECAIDRETIAKGLGYGYWQAIYQIPPRGSIAYNPDFPLARKYNPEKAKQLLAEAGYPNGFKTAIIACPLNLNRDVVVAVQADLAKVGIQADLDFPEGSKWFTYLGPAGVWPRGAAIISPVPQFDPLFLGGMEFMFGTISQNWLRTPELLQAYEAALTSPEPDAKLIRAVTDMMSRDALYIPISELGRLRADQPYVVAGFNERGFLTIVNYEDVWLNK